MHQQNSNYTLQGESRRILQMIMEDERLAVPREVQSLASSVKFTGDEEQPFYPVPLKCAEMHAALLGYVGILASTISKERFNEKQTIEVDIDHALMSGLGALFVRHEDQWFSGNQKMMSAVKRWDHGHTRELYRQLATNIYRSADNRWYSLHGSMDPTPVLDMLGLPQHDDKDRSWQEILSLYMETVGSIDSETLDNLSNNIYRVPGTICYEKDEFKNIAQGKAVKDEPLYNIIRPSCYKQPPSAWNMFHAPQDDYRPLSGIKVVELARAIAAPTIGRVCAALGATVIRVSCREVAELPITLIDGCIGKINVDVNLKTFEGRKKLLELISEADVFIDGYRPSVLEHLGFGRDAVFGLVEKRDRGIIYCQENCYGWKGPWSTRPGWAQIADTVSGVGIKIGQFNGFDEPHIFPGPNADYLTGHAGAAGVLHALLQRSKIGGSYNIQCSLVVSNLHLLGLGEYNSSQLAALKARNAHLIGHTRHFDEIRSHGVNRHCINAFVADRSSDKAIKPEYYQKVDASPWGLEGTLDIVGLGFQMSSMRTDFTIGPAPPGYHLPIWTETRNSAFDPL